MPTDKVIHWPWPTQVNASAWSISFTWDPGIDVLDELSLTDLEDLEALLDPDTYLDVVGGVLDSTTAGLLQIDDDDGMQVGKVEWGIFEDDLPGFRFTLGIQTVTITDLAAGLGEAVRLRARFSTTEGMALTAQAVSLGTVHASDPSATDPGTTTARPGHVWLGLASDGTTAGEGNAGAGNAGGVNFAGGTMADFEMHEDRLTDAEAATADIATVVPEGRQVMYASLADALEPYGSVYASGRRFEATADDGTTRVADSNGFTKAIAVLAAKTVDLPGFALGMPGTGELLAFAATTEASDDLADVHAQWAAASEQEVRIR